MMNQTATPIIEMRNIKSLLGDHWVHTSLDLDVMQGEVLAIVGSSGCGKTTLLRNILMLLPPTDGELRVFGEDILNCTPAMMQSIRQRWGMMFQHGALFSSLSVLDNIIYPLKEFAKLPLVTCREIALLKLSLAGLSLDAANKFPAELSGGMIKRAALARSLTLDPELLLLDEPTAGLDPESADAFDRLIKELHQSLKLTIVMVTHDLDTLWEISDRVAFLGEGKTLACSPMEELVKETNSTIHNYFNGPRGQVRIKGQRKQTS